MFFMFLPNCIRDGQEGVVIIDVDLFHYCRFFEGGCDWLKVASI